MTSHFDLEQRSLEAVHTEGMGYLGSDDPPWIQLRAGHSRRQTGWLVVSYRQSKWSWKNVGETGMVVGPKLRICLEMDEASNPMTRHLMVDLQRLLHLFPR